MPDTPRDQQLAKVKTGVGFFAALDQSGGSTPRALLTYGIDESAYDGEEQMFQLVHEMRSRIVTSPAFNGKRIIGAILFERTMDGQFDGVDAPDYLWKHKAIVPFLKVDKGLAEESDGVQVMNPIHDLDRLLTRARAKGIFGTKMRSVIRMANPSGIQAVVNQQFEIGHRILDAGFVPIIEPEVDIHSPQKAKAEELLRDAIVEQSDQLDASQQVMLKLTLPEVAGLYSDLVAHDRILRVLALSGGYSRVDANGRLALNNGLIASFSRALVEGLRVDQTDDDFNEILDRSIQSIYAASRSA